MILLIPISLIILFIAVRKFYKWKAKMENERRKERLKAELDRLLEMDEIEEAISN